MRRVRGTASLIYFLCRPLVKISYMGDPTDPRSVVKRPAGPFLQLEGSNFSRPQIPDGSNPVIRFDPGFPWAGGGKADTHWGAPGAAVKCEISDSYFHPLCYDKVKTYSFVPLDEKYFQAKRFHYYGSPGSYSSPMLGGVVHPDQEFLQQMPTPDDDELLQTPDWPDYGGALSTANVDCHGDPRWVKWFTPGGGRYNTGGPADPVTASTGDHAPRNVGGYDLWSTGRSWTNTRDDITSWE
jgi:hypothetical protein